MKPKKLSRGRPIGAIVLSLLGILLGGILWMSALSVGLAAAGDSYDAAKSSARNTAYRESYDKSYADAEADYHVRNDVVIQLGAIREESMLEVLRITDEEYIVEDPSYKAQSIYSWLSVRGTGIFTVNMQAGEYIVDNEHHYVLVRIPEPEMTQFDIDHANTEQLFYADKSIKITVPILQQKLQWNDGSYQIGTELFNSQELSAYTTIREKITSNQNYYKKARESARTQIARFVRALNTDAALSDLEVEVEFM